MNHDSYSIFETSNQLLLFPHHPCKITIVSLLLSFIKSLYFISRVVLFCIKSLL